MPMRSHISAISFTRPMLIMRKVFSSSFTISATRVELTGITVSSACWIKQRTNLSTCRRYAADYFGNVRGLKLWIAWIHALRRETEEKILAYAQVRFLQLWQNQLVRGARVGCRFEHNQQTGMQILRNCVSGRDDIAHVRVLRFAKRSRHANIDGIELADGGKVGCGAQFSALHKRAENFIVHVFDVGMAVVELLDLSGLNINASNIKSRLGEFDCERQPDVSKAEHTHLRRPICNALAQSFCRSGQGCYFCFNYFSRQEQRLLRRHIQPDQSKTRFHPSAT